MERIPKFSLDYFLIRYIMPYMGAELLFHRKNIESDGGIIEMKIWKVPQSSDKAFGVKYSLVYIQNGKRIIGYDNAEGKGDHKHYRNNEYQYRFSNIDNLIKDFCTDLEKAKRGEL